MNIIVFGPQASGKGTQAHFLSEKLGLFYLSTGDLFRKYSKQDPNIEKMVKSGGLPPDDLAFSLLKKYLEEEHGNCENVIFDGFPRNANQYRMLKTYLSEKKTKIDYAILLDINNKEALRRLSARRACSKCKKIYNLITKPPKNPESCDNCGGKLVQREDDKPKAIKRRLSLYRNITQPLIGIFEKEGILVKVDGERPINTISEELLSLLQK